VIEGTKTFKRDQFIIPDVFVCLIHYGNHTPGSVNVKKQKRIIDVDRLQVLEAALLLFIACVCVQIVTESNLTVKIKTINTLPLVGTIFSTEDCF
jgi:hypothetical protein